MIKKIKRIVRFLYFKFECAFLPKKFENRVNKFKYKAIIENHTTKGVENWIKGILEYTQIKSGNIKKGEGDVVIVNLKETVIPIKELLEPIFYIDRIETNGIYTNIYFERKVFIQKLAFIKIKRKSFFKRLCLKYFH